MKTPTLDKIQAKLRGEVSDLLSLLDEARELIKTYHSEYHSEGCDVCNLLKRIKGKI